MQTISDVLKTVRLGKETCWQNLTVFPLLRDLHGEPDYLTLDEALALGSAHITEVSDGGSVPELTFVNEGDRPVLLLDGEELLGAKQNRVLNLTILVPAHKTLTIPVSCVEAGRWAHRSAEFAAAPRAHFAEGRAKKMEQVTESMQLSEGRARRSNQSEVWHDVDRMCLSLDVSSHTSAMADIYEQHDSSLEDSVRAFTPEAEQVGAVFAINGKVVGLELFDHAQTFGKLLPKLVRSYALDALAKHAEPEAVSSPMAVETLLQEIAEAKADRFGATGMGDEARLTGEGLTGGALIVEERLVHLSAFRRPGKGEPASV